MSRVPITVDPTRKRTYWFTNKETVTTDARHIGR